jgi:hypothetical protein
MVKHVIILFRPTCTIYAADLPASQAETSTFGEDG